MAIKKLQINCKDQK